MNPDRPAEPLYDSTPLFTPSLQHFASPAARPAGAWSPQAQFFVAFFAGITSLAIFALMNGVRLKVPRSRMAVMVIVSIVGWVTYWAATQFLPTLPLDEVIGSSALGTGMRSVRLAGRALAIVLYLVLHWLQLPADRVYRSLWNGKYASPWWPAVGSFVVGMLVDTPVAFFLALFLK